MTGNGKRIRGDDNLIIGCTEKTDSMIMLIKMTSEQDMIVRSYAKNNS